MIDFRRKFQVCAILAAVALMAGSALRTIGADETSVASAAPKFSPADLAFFEKDVRPLLAENCFKCHNEKKQKGKLRLDARSLIIQGGEKGAAVNLANPEKSLLLKAIGYSDEDMQMPPDGKLAQAKIDILSKWVKAGAPWTPGEAPVATAAGPATAEASRDPEKNRDYWAYVPATRPALTVLKAAGLKAWAAKSPIDAFIAAKLEAKGLTPSAPADRVALLRRAYYDLTGLPPTPEEIDAFVNDPSAEAWEKRVDALLASPHYGEKWGRHWLDLVRYAETNGYERDGPKPQAWRYRDYVIRSFNNDKPYNQFLKEQIAGDELDHVTSDSVIATGYYRLGIWDDEPADRLLARYDVLDGIVSTTSAVALGMSVGCARCHDHKRDPIPQKDYYKLLAFFQDVSDMNGSNLKMVAEPSAPGASAQVKDLSKKPNGHAEGSEVMCAFEVGRDRPTHVLLRGNPNAEGDLVVPGFPQVLTPPGAQPPVLPKADPSVKSSGKRRILAEWLASDDNTIVARTMANRVWQYHFGRGIVPTPNDYGKLGEQPTHPELLNWLTTELIADHWQLKPLHKLIMMSNAYQMSSRANEEGMKADPENNLFWRFNMRRLGAEEVRDSVLAVAGTLSPTMGGPSVFPPIPAEVKAGQSVPGSGWGKATPEEANRRSVYVHVKRSLLVPILSVHDQADTDSSCPVRFTTTVPTQALGMINGEFTNEEAGTLAQRVKKEVGGDLAAEVKRAIRLTTGRVPAEAEVQSDIAFINQLKTAQKLSDDEALRLYCLLALNANEFVYLD